MLTIVVFAFPVWFLNQLTICFLRIFFRNEINFKIPPVAFTSYFCFPCRHDFISFTTQNSICTDPFILFLSHFFLPANRLPRCYLDLDRQ